MLLFNQLIIIFIFLNPSWLFNFYIDKYEIYLIYILILFVFLFFVYLILVKIKRENIPILDKFFFSLIIFIFLDLNFGFLKISKIFNITSTVVEFAYPLILLLIIFLINFKLLKKNYSKLKKILVAIVVSVSIINLFNFISLENNNLQNDNKDDTNYEIYGKNIIIILDSFSNYLGDSKDLNQKFSEEKNKLKDFNFVIFENVFTKFYYTNNSLSSLLNFTTDLNDLNKLQKVVYRNGRPSNIMIKNKFLRDHVSSNNFVMNHFLFDMCQAELKKIVNCEITGNQLNPAHVQFMGYSDSFILRSSYFMLLKLFNKNIFHPFFSEKKNINKHLNIIKNAFLNKYDNYIILLQSSHPPNILDSECNISINYSSSYLDEFSCHINILEDLFLFMKKNEIFDMYNIHILGDHGQRRYDSINGLDNNELLSIFQTFYAYKGDNISKKIDQKSIISNQDLFKNLVLEDDYDFNTKAFILRSDDIPGFLDEITEIELKNVLNIDN